MQRDNGLAEVFVARELADRRIATKNELPFFTEEGLVLFDRREYLDRRSSEPRHSARDQSRYSNLSI